jgi:hypothetical protein
VAGHGAMALTTSFSDHRNTMGQGPMAPPALLTSNIVCPKKLGCDPEISHHYKSAFYVNAVGAAR